MPKLTNRLIEAAEIHAAEYFIWDDDLPGFGPRVLPSGRKGYVVQYRAGRRSRRMSLGPNTVLTCEQARTRAIGIIAATRNGDNPATARDADRKTITVKELAERFDKEQILVRVKASTAKGYRYLLERKILPAIGRHHVTEVTRADIAKLHHDLRHIPYEANRCLEVISKMFSLAEMWGLRPDGSNPRKRKKKYAEEKAGAPSPPDRGCRWSASCSATRRYRRLPGTLIWQAIPSRSPFALPRLAFANILR